MKRILCSCYLLRRKTFSLLDIVFLVGRSWYRITLHLEACFFCNARLGNVEKGKVYKPVEEWDVKDKNEET